MSTLASEQMHEPNLHVVLGAGPLGLAVARHLASRGDRVGGHGSRRTGRPTRKALRSSTQTLPSRPTRSGHVRGSGRLPPCQPAVRKWSDLHPPLMDAVIEMAAAAGGGLCSATTSTPTVRWTDRSEGPARPGDPPERPSPGIGTTLDARSRPRITRSRITWPPDVGPSQALQASRRLLPRHGHHRDQER